MSGLIPAPASVRVTKAPLAVPTSTIVGRARCQSTTWLLFESNELVSLPDDRARTSLLALRGLAATDNVWGLACLADDTVWTLASPRTLARVDSTARLAERIELPLPRVALFGAGNRLLFQQLPAVLGTAALAASPPHQPLVVSTWPGLMSRSGATRERELANNLATCGLPFGARIPCWFTDQSRFTVSDGIQPRSFDAPWAIVSDDREAPIRDIALTAVDRYWLLASGRDPRDGRRAGTALFRVVNGTTREATISLNPPARLILSATDDRCVLLATTGELIEVVVPS